MKKINYKIIFITIMICFLTVPLAVSASIASIEAGGWSEDSGYYTTSKNYPSASHKGWRENATINSSSAARACGETSWIGNYHYTRAMMKSYYFGYEVILQDSTQQWGWNYTSAKSPWQVFNGTNDLGSARTYYGK